MSKQILISLFVMLYFNSCVKEIELESTDFHKQLVLNSLITPDSIITIYITTTKPVLDTNIYYVNNATVLLYENEILLDTMIAIGNGKYIATDIYPISLAEYKIIVNADGYESITTNDNVPNKTVLTEVIYTKDHLFDQYGDTYIEYNIHFSDNPLESNYYEIIIFEKNYSPDLGSTSILYPYGLTDANQILVNEGDQEYEPITMFFSDALFNGDSLNFYAKFQNGNTGSEIPGNYLPSLENGSYVELRSISENYYNYRKAWTRHSYSQPTGGYVSDPLQLIFITEPVEMFTDIENGYGIFAAYQTDTKELIFIP